MSIRRRAGWSAAALCAMVLALTTLRGDPALGAGIVLLVLLGAATVGLGVLLLPVTLGVISVGRDRRREATLLPGLAASLGLTFAERDDDALASCPEGLLVGAVAPKAERVLTGWTAAGTLTAFELSCLRIEQTETVPYRHVVLCLAAPRSRLPQVLLRPLVTSSPAGEGRPGSWTIEGLPSPVPEGSVLADALRADLLRLGGPSQANAATVRVDGDGAVAWWRGALRAEALPGQVAALTRVADAVAALAAPPPAVEV